MYSINNTPITVTKNLEVTNTRSQKRFIVTVQSECGEPFEVIGISLEGVVMIGAETDMYSEMTKAVTNFVNQ